MYRLLYIYIYNFETNHSSFIDQFQVGFLSTKLLNEVVIYRFTTFSIRFCSFAAIILYL